MLVVKCLVVVWSHLWFTGFGLLGLRVGAMRCLIREGLKRKVLMVYLTAGDPYVSGDTVRAISECGVRIFEFGIPLARPKYDGPTIRASYKRVLENYTALEEIFSIIKSFHVDHKIIFTYLEYAKRIGLERIAELALESGAEGLLFPDLLIDYPEELGAYMRLCKEYDLEPIFFATSSFPHRLVSRLAELNPAFIYLGLMASTGILLPITISRTIRIMRGLIGGTPLLVGFAISEPHQVSNCIRAGADGVIVGSAIIKLLCGASDLDGLKEYVLSLIKALEV
ncbi:MAG: tryptophan synthase subunit alpha [Candidatus Bathyarchaeia archaeon]